MRTLLLSFLLANGMMPSCSDDVDLGNNADATVADAGSADSATPDTGGFDSGAPDSGLTCTGESECGPIPPGLPCGDINAGLTCEAVAGTCQWNDHCPAHGEECSAGSCEGPEPTCGILDRPAPAPPASGALCIANERACEWETPACECQPEDCGPEPGGIACMVECERDDTDRCSWVSHCPGEGEECAEGACGELPPTLPCSALMSTEQTGRCITLGGMCQWEHVECGCEDSFCGERGLAPNCGDTAMPASPGPCERDEASVCEWSWLCE